jgi:hypothetical protein
MHTTIDKIMPRCIRIYARITCQPRTPVEQPENLIAAALGSRPVAAGTPTVAITTSRRIEPEPPSAPWSLLSNSCRSRLTRLYGVTPRTTTVEFGFISSEFSHLKGGREHTAALP